MSMGRTTQILGFSVPPTVVKEVEDMAKEERRTKSELFREMVRVYRRYRSQRDRDEDRWIANLVAEARAEQARNPMSPEELLKESQRLAEFGERQAKRLGLKTDMRSINRMIYERRKARKS
jgi:metal-responsive CopG/Arc/MetJ family transcriptional regulator